MKILFRLLKDMYKLSLILNKQRILHGALEFGMPQQKIKLDEKGFPIDFEILSQGTGENLIEEFMLVANQTVAQALGEYDYPTMYRVHDVPAPEVVNYFIELINKLGIKYQRREQLVYNMKCNILVRLLIVMVVSLVHFSMLF